MQTQRALVSAILSGKGDQVLGRSWSAPWLLEFPGSAVQLRPDLKGLQAAGDHKHANSLIGYFQVLNEGAEVLRTRMVFNSPFRPLVRILVTITNNTQLFILAHVIPKLRMGIDLDNRNQTFPDFTS